MADNSTTPQVVFSNGEKKRHIDFVKKFYNDATLRDAFQLLIAISKTYYSDGNFVETIAFQVTIRPVGKESSLISQSELAKLTTKRYSPDDDAEDQKKYAYIGDVVRLLGGIKRVIESNQGQSVNYDDNSILIALSVLRDQLVDEQELESLGLEITNQIVEIIIAFFKLFEPSKRPQSPQVIKNTFPNSNLVDTFADDIYLAITPEEDVSIDASDSDSSGPARRAAGTATVPKKTKSKGATNGTNQLEFTDEIVEEQTQSTLYGQDRDRDYFAKQRRIQNESAWLYNRALYELFYDVGLTGADIPPELQQELFGTVRNFALGLDDKELDKLFASPSARQRALISLFTELERSGFRRQLNQFYRSYAESLPREEQPAFAKLVVDNKSVFSGKVLSLDQKLEIQLTTTLKITKESNPLLFEEIKDRVDDLIELYGAKIQTVIFDGNELSLRDAKSSDDIAEFLDKFLTPAEIRDVFQLPDSFSLEGVDFARLKKIIINYARQHAAVLLVENQNPELLEGTVSLKDKFDNLKSKPDEKTRHVNYLVITAEERKEFGSEKNVAHVFSKNDRAYQKMLKLYKPFIPLWNGLSTEEQIAVYKQYNYPTRQFELLNDPAQKLPFILEFINFDVTKLEYIRLRGSTRRPGIYEERRDELMQHGIDRRRKLGKEILYLHSLRDLSLTEIDQKLSENVDYQNYNDAQKAELLDRIVELRQFTKEEIFSALLLQRKLTGEINPDVETYETSALIAKFSNIRNLAALQENNFNEILNDEGRPKKDLLREYGVITQEQLQNSVDDFAAIVNPQGGEVNTRYQYFSDQDDDEPSLSFFSRQILSLPPAAFTNQIAMYYPAVEEIPAYEDDTVQQFVPQNSSLSRIKNYFQQSLYDDIDANEGGAIKKFLKKKAFPSGTTNHSNDSWFRSKIKGTFGDKLKEKYGDKLQELLSKGGFWGMAARMLIDSKYRKKRLKQIAAIGGGSAILLYNLLKGAFTTLAGGIGGILGGVIGGVGGFFIGGPVGAIAGAMAGAGVGASFTSVYLPRWFPNLFGQSPTPNFTSSFIPQGEFSPHAATNSFARTSPTTSQTAQLTSRVNRIPTEGRSINQAVRPEFAQAQAQTVAANQALAQQTVSQQLAAQAAAEQAVTSTLTSAGVTTALTSYALAIPGGSLAIIFLISMYNLMVINSAFLIPVPPDIGVGGNNYCGTGNAAEGCFSFDTIGGDTFTSGGDTAITKPITAIEEQRVRSAFSNNAGKYSAYVDKLCADGPIQIKKLSDSDSPGLGVFGWTANKDTLVFYERGLASDLATEVTLLHESGHILDLRNRSGSSAGLLDSFLNVWSGDMYTYTNTVVAAARSAEAFSEGVMNYLLPNYSKPKPGLPPGVVEALPTVRDFPDEYQWFSQNVFGNQNGLSCGGPVTGNVGNTGDIYIAVGSNDINNVVITQNTEIRDTSSPFNTVQPCRWREIKGLDVSMNANFFNPGNIPVGPAGESPVKYYANQTHVNTPDYMVNNVDMYGFKSGDSTGSVYDIEKTWQDNKKPFVMSDYSKAVAGLVELTSNVSDKRRKVALGVSSDNSTFYLGIIVEGDYTELREALKNNGADKIIFLDGGNSAAFCPKPGSAFTSGGSVPSLDANRTVPINIGMKSVDSFIKIPGTAAP